MHGLTLLSIDIVKAFIHRQLLLYCTVLNTCTDGNIFLYSSILLLIFVNVWSHKPNIVQMFRKCFSNQASNQYLPDGQLFNNSNYLFSEQCNDNLTTYRCYFHHSIFITGCEIVKFCEFSHFALFLREQTYILVKSVRNCSCSSTARIVVALLQMKYILFVGENAAEYQWYKNAPSNLD